MQQVGVERDTGTATPLEHRAESAPYRFIGKPAHRLEVSRDRPVVLHAAALNDELRIELFVFQAKMQERPGRQGGEHRATAPEYGLMVVGVGLQWRPQQYLLQSGHFDLHAHYLRERDVL